MLNAVDIDKILSNDYSWMKIKKYEENESLDWEEKYKRLKWHHLAETTILFKALKELADEVKGYRSMF